MVALYGGLMLEYIVRHIVSSSISTFAFSEPIRIYHLLILNFCEDHSINNKETNIFSEGDAGNLNFYKC